MKTNSPQAWLLAIRPYSLGNAVILIAIASAMAWRAGAFAWLPALLCTLFAVLMQATANLVNDLCDGLKGADRADRLGPDRAFAKGYITRRAMLAGIAACTLAAVVTGFAALGWALHHDTLRYGGWEIVATGAACILCAYLYTAGPRPLAYHALGDVAVLLFFGLVPVSCTFYLLTGTWPATVTCAALACGAVIDTMLMINNFRDRNEDTRSHKRTLVVCFGARFGSWSYLALGLTATALAFGALPGRPLAASLLLPYLALHVATWRKIVRIDHGRELNVTLGETARNIWLFGALFTLAILIGA